MNKSWLVLGSVHKNVNTYKFGNLFTLMKILKFVKLIHLNKITLLVADEHCQDFDTFWPSR